MSTPSVLRGPAPNLVNGVRSGRPPGPLGSPSADTGVVKNLLAPPGKSLYFITHGGIPVVYEFRGGRFTRPTWAPGREGHDRLYYKRGDSFGTAKVNRRVLLAMFQDAEISPEATGTARLVLAVLGEKEEYEVGYEIVGVEAGAAGGWEGRLTLRTYYVDPDTKERKYGVVRTWAGQEAQYGFEQERLSAGLAETADVMEAAVTTLVEVTLTLDTVGLGSVVRAGERRVLARVLKYAAEDGPARSLLKAGIRRSVRAAFQLAKVLDTVAVAGLTAFVKALGASLIQDAKGRPEVVWAACKNITWPVTTVVGQSDTWVIDWQKAVGLGVTAAAAAMAGKALDDAFDEYHRSRAATDATVAKAMTGSYQLRDFGLEAELRKVLTKLFATDLLTGVIKVVGTAVSETKSPTEFAEKSKDEALKEFKGAVKEAFKSAAEAVLK